MPLLPPHALAPYRALFAPTAAEANGDDVEAARLELRALLERLGQGGLDRRSALRELRVLEERLDRNDARLLRAERACWRIWRNQRPVTRSRAGVRAADVPVLMLTARGQDEDRIVGLELGADDYLPKPFNPRELLARLRAVLRRRAAGRPQAAVLRFGRLEIDRDARVVRLDGEERVLTRYQFDLLVALAESAGRVLSRETLMARAGHAQRGVRPLDRRPRLAHPRRDRGRPAAPAPLLTVRGAGYVFARKQDEDE